MNVIEQLEWEHGDAATKKRIESGELLCETCWKAKYCGRAFHQGMRPWHSCESYEEWTEELRKLKEQGVCLVCRGAGGTAHDGFCSGCGTSFGKHPCYFCGKV